VGGGVTEFHLSIFPQRLEVSWTLCSFRLDLDRKKLAKG